jgi:protoporphyrin/coproporphyrin ferrochelatase
MKFLGLGADRHRKTDAIGVLLINLGTPSAPTAPAVRRYLRQFLSDPRVIELPRLLWWLLLNLVILPIRGFRSAANYRKVWTEQGSPLMLLSQSLCAKVQAQLDDKAGNFSVQLAMSYGEPSIAQALQILMQNGAKRLVVLPLYPQYSGTTTGSVFDGVSKALQQHRWVPDFRFISQYYERAEYTQALVDSIRAHWAEHGRANKLLLSFHGIPKRYFSNGDLYHCHCYGTARRVREALDLSPDELLVSFQSRVGKEEWLRPYTDEVIKSLPASGVKTLDVICPGFAVDCLETLEEIQGENAEYFTHAGGESLRYIAALNDTDTHAQLLAAVVDSHSQGWVEAQHKSVELAAYARELQARVEQHQATLPAAKF